MVQHVGASGPLNFDDSTAPWRRITKIDDRATLRRIGPHDLTKIHHAYHHNPCDERDEGENPVPSVARLSLAVGLKDLAAPMAVPEQAGSRASSTRAHWRTLLAVCCARPKQRHCAGSAQHHQWDNLKEQQGGTAGV